MPIYLQWMDVLAYLIVGSIAFLVAVNTSLRRERRAQRAAHQQQIQELEKRIQLYDAYTAQLRDDLVRYKALVDDQRSSLETLNEQLNKLSKIIHLN